MPNLFSDVASNPDFWAQPSPIYADVVTAFGHASTATGPVVKAGLLGLSVRSPTIVAFMLAGDNDHIYIGYQPCAYPADVSCVSLIKCLMVSSSRSNRGCSVIPQCVLVMALISQREAQRMDPLVTL